jgi:hypothetical protein
MVFLQGLHLHSAYLLLEVLGLPALVRELVLQVLEVALKGDFLPSEVVDFVALRDALLLEPVGLIVGFLELLAPDLDGLVLIL